MKSINIKFLNILVIVIIILLSGHYRSYSKDKIKIIVTGELTKLIDCGNGCLEFHCKSSEEGCYVFEIEHFRVNNSDFTKFNVIVETITYECLPEKVRVYQSDSSFVDRFYIME